MEFVRDESSKPWCTNPLGFRPKSTHPCTTHSWNLNSTRYSIIHKRSIGQLTRHCTQFIGVRSTLSATDENNYCSKALRSITKWSTENDIPEDIIVVPTLLWRFTQTFLPNLDMSNKHRSMPSVNKIKHHRRFIETVNPVRRWRWNSCCRAV